MTILLLSLMAHQRACVMGPELKKVKKGPVQDVPIEVFGTDHVVAPPSLTYRPSAPEPKTELKADGPRDDDATATSEPQPAPMVAPQPARGQQQPVPHPVPPQSAAAPQKTAQRRYASRESVLGSGIVTDRPQQAALAKQRRPRDPLASTMHNPFQSGTGTQAGLGKTFSSGRLQRSLGGGCAPPAGQSLGEALGPAKRTLWVRMAHQADEDAVDIEVRTHDTVSQFKKLVSCSVGPCRLRRHDSSSCCRSWKSSSWTFRARR